MDAMDLRNTTWDRLYIISQLMSGKEIVGTDNVYTGTGEITIILFYN